MTLTPWDIPAPNADDPAPRIIPLHRSAAARPRQGSNAPPGSPADMIQRLRDRLNREARHVVIEPTWLDELAEDWRDFASEVRRSPVSHALVAVLTVIGWTVLLVAPLLIGEWWS